MTLIQSLRRFSGHAIIVLSFLTLLVPSAMATHLRGGTITWAETNVSGTQYTIQFTFQYSQRWSYPNSPGICGGGVACPSVGTTVNMATISGNGTFNFGDGSGTLTPNGTVTSVNQAEDWYTATFTFTHIYRAPGPFTAYFFGSNRISTLQLGHDEPEYISTSVSNYPNGAPVASVPAFIAVPLLPTATFNLGSAVTDIDPTVHLNFRVATFLEMYGPTNISGIGSLLCPSGIDYAQGVTALAQPPGFTISSAGVVTWNTTLIQPSITGSNCGFAAPKANDLWATQVIVEARDTNNIIKTSIPVDLILKFVTPVGALPTLTLNPAGTQTLQTGTPVSFTATGSSTNTGAKITLNASGVPVGATASNLNAMLTPPVTSTFNWTPTSSQAGTFVITYVATDNNFQQTSASKTIVVAAAPPTATCSSPISVPYGQTGTLSASVFDPSNQLLSVAWTVDGNAVQTNSNVMAFPTAATVNLIQNYGAVGGHSVVATATDPRGVTASCTTSANVTKADQTITFAALPDVPFGTPDFVLNATASSGLAVSYATVGGCSVSGSTLHLTGAGSCQVTASQAGDTNNNAAPNVAQSFNVLVAAVTATAGGGSSTYDGTPKSPSACVVSGTYTGDLTCSNSPASVGPDAGTTAIVPVVSGSNLGSYTITAVNGSFSIAKAISVTTVACPASVTYNGAAQTPCTATVTGGGGFTEAVTVSYTSNTSAGTATATANFAGNTNNNASSGTATFSIAKALLAATAGGYSGGYDGSAHALGACSVSINFDAITCTNSPAGPVGPDAGSGAVTPTVVGVTGNYNVTLNNGAWSITQAASVVTVTCPPSVTYSGSAQTPCSATVTGAGGLNQPLNLTYTANVNAGVATATATFAGDTDHTATTNSATFAIAVAPSVVAVTCPATVPYNGSAQTPCSATVTGVGGLSATLPVTYSPITAGPGAVTASATFAGDSNHSGNSGSGSFTISQAPTTTVVSCPASVTYTGSAQTPCTALVTGAGLSTTAAVSYSNNTVAGVASATASYAGSSLYSASSGSATFTIAKAASVVAITCPTSVTYTGSAVTPCTATVTGAGGLNQSATVTYTNNTVGTATATASFAGDANHNSSSATKTFTILYSTGSCLGSSGHTILQPINSDGSSVWKTGSTVPAKFRVCDASGNSISATVVKSFYLVSIISGTVVTNPDEIPDSTTPDTTFRWSSAPDSQWIFNINTKGLAANSTYVYQITLNDNSVIQFQYGLK
jgi:hypothetical protein